MKIYEPKCDQDLVFQIVNGDIPRHYWYDQSFFATRVQSVWNLLSDVHSDGNQWRIDLITEARKGIFHPLVETGAVCKRLCFIVFNFYVLKKRIVLRDVTTLFYVPIRYFWKRDEQRNGKPVVPDHWRVLTRARVHSFYEDISRESPVPYPVVWLIAATDNWCAQCSVRRRFVRGGSYTYIFVYIIYTHVHTYTRI